MQDKDQDQDPRSAQDQHQDTHDLSKQKDRPSSHSPLALKLDSPSIL